MKKQLFNVAMYLRLSRDDEDIDGSKKSESNSIGSQREIIRTYIREHDDMELYDIYVDDGFTGSNFERPEFKRMMSDIEAKRVNCVIVKDLSRFGRDYIEAGRYIQKTFPALSVRFIALTDHYDSFNAEASESSIVLPVKNFINDSYCRDISTKVKSQLEVKRKNGEFIGAFAVYGYLKNPENKNKLIVDDYAADIVNKVFNWKLEGLSSNAIAKKLNELGILSPMEYKKSKGVQFSTGFAVNTKTGWSSVAIKRILTNEVYLGHLVQGKREKVNYKVKKIVKKPEEEWARVEQTHEAIISQDVFDTVQNLMQTDGRISPKMEEANPFAGLLFCGDCKEQMVRRVNHYKDTERVYYICSTNNRAEGCSRHSIEEAKLLSIVSKSLVHYANAYLNQSILFCEVKTLETNFEVITKYDKEIGRLREEQDKYYKLCSGLYEDLRLGIITKPDFERLHASYTAKSEEIEASLTKQEDLIKRMFKKGISAGNRLDEFKKVLKLTAQDIDRKTMASLIKSIYVFEDKRVEIEFNFIDEFEIMLNANKVIEYEKKEKLNTNAERSA